MSANLPLLNKRAIVTGGSRGIGAAIVRKLAEQGAQVAFTYSASPDAAQTLVEEIIHGGGLSFAIKADSADPAGLQAPFARQSSASADWIFWSIMPARWFML